MSPPRLTRLFLAVLDLVCVVVAFHVIGWLWGVLVIGDLDLLPLLAPFVLVFLVLSLIDGYSPHTDMLSATYASQHSIAMVAGMVVMLLVTFVFIKAPYALQSSRAVIALSFVALIPMTLSYRRWLALRVAAERQKRPIIFIGSEASCIAFRDTCDKNHTKQQVIYVATDTARHESVTPFVGIEMSPVSQLGPILIRCGGLIEAVVLHETSRDLPFAVSEKLLELHFSGVRAYTLELFHEVYWRKIPLDRLNQTWLFEEGFQIARDPVFERIKRLSDIVFAVTGLVLASPLLLLCAVAIRLDDRGPVLFWQPRVGKHRVLFQICKLRTMRPSAHTTAPYTEAGDVRVTRVGRLLRAMRLDEIPQLWNVLRGDMSLIGPRAEWSKLVEGYEREIPCYHFRHLVKPGITGWAQVNYPYGANLDDTLRKLEFDLYYIRHFSFVLDASIVLKTIHVMLVGKGR
jgi:exopolysaccharide biosynthesis polyprenyl glycosylphosphotransferase